MIRINLHLREIFPRVLFLEDNFSDLTLDFPFFHDDIFL